MGWFLPIEVSFYDPGIKEWSNDPKPEDYLLCADVLEHVEPDLIDNVIKHLISKFNKKALLSISLMKSRKILPNGNNTHLLIKPSKWWIKKLEQYATIEDIQFVSKDKPIQKDLIINLTKEER